MIKVTVELVPLGNELLTEKIAQFCIFNNGKISDIKGKLTDDNTYYYKTCGWFLPFGEKEIRYFDSDGVEHNRNEDVLTLIKEVLIDLEGPYEPKTV